MNQKHVHIATLLGRLALFVVYFWFGALKIAGLSPANPMVSELLTRTLPFVSFQSFIIFFACVEMLIGILFLIPRLEKIALILFLLHMATTMLPLFVLPFITWSGFMTPTLEGQYIIKNVVLIALAIFVYVINENPHIHVTSKFKNKSRV